MKNTQVNLQFFRKKKFETFLMDVNNKYDQSVEGQ